ncbi:MAG: methylmalonyl Co-A mutase-associated GTPase MeaB [Bacteroidetes bacterium]|nr:methylmalonyl Co-A mutase-associated GTPase MeaB [Bacteroidota bacterium]
MARQRGSFDPALLLAGLRNGDRNSLARALTLVESDRLEHRKLARQVLEACLREKTTATAHASLRIGITGVPGVGKSTFIESLGMMLINAGHRVGVMAVDPSSEKSGGSILGDKTRMEKLAAHESAFIRPSPARGTLGGVADRTREHILLFEAAGYDVVMVETVGVGQSETAVHGMVDCFLLLLLPGAGDELQGIKRGIVEMADLLVVNKSDGDFEKRAVETQRDYERALHLFPPTESGWVPPVLRCSSTIQNGMSVVLEKLLAFRDAMHTGGHFARRRQEQAGSWLHEAIRDGLSAGFYANPAIRRALAEEETAVRAGNVHPLQAAERLLERFRER